jgi:hypothetical protein
MASSAARTEIIYGTSNIIKRTLQRLSATSEKIDVCISASAPEGTVKAEQIFKEKIRLKKIGIKIRYITEITQRNLPYCKDLMLTAELRHMDGIKGNFSIVDERDYQATAAVKEGDPPDESVLSTARAFVEQQQYIFDTLWHKAIPAKQRIKEIEHGLKREFMDTMQDPYETQKILDNLLKSATEEILIILPTTTTNNILYQYEQEYLLTLLKNAAVEQGVRIRILVNESIKERIEREIFTRSSSDLIEIQLLDRQQQNKVITVIVDKELCLTAEVKDDDNYDSAVEVLGLATYSNSESTVLSFASIFETLWLQAELKNEQKKAARIT